MTNIYSRIYTRIIHKIFVYLYIYIYQIRAKLFCLKFSQNTSEIFRDERNQMIIYEHDIIIHMT